MASPSTVVSLGFGTFGSVYLLPTLGFGVGEPPVDVAAPGGTIGIEYVIPPHRRHATAEATNRQATVMEHRRHAVASPNDY